MVTCKLLNLKMVSACRVTGIWASNPSEDLIEIPTLLGEGGREKGKGEELTYLMVFIHSSA